MALYVSQDLDYVPMTLYAVPVLLIAALSYLSLLKNSGSRDALEAIHQLLNLPLYMRKKANLPCVPFRWPNGQGTEKFFGGREAAQNWRNLYGPLYGIWSGFKREIVITRPNQVKAFYRDSHLHTKSSDNNAGWLFEDLLGECVGVVSQKRWKRVRGHFDSHFTRGAAAEQTVMFIAEAESFLDSLKSSQNETVIDPANDLKYCPFYMVAGIFFGPLTSQQRETLHRIGPGREALFREAFMGGVNRFKLTKYLPNSALSRLRIFQSEWEQFVREAAEIARQRGSGSIKSLWKLVQTNELSMSELLQTLDESLFANLDVTTHALSWNILRIAQHKDIQDKVWLELKGCTATPEGFESFLRKEDSLLAACILEASRLHPVLPFSNPEAAEDDKLIDGYIIPRKTDVIVDAYAINVDNPFWQNPKEYDPYRYKTANDQSRRYNMWRFGFGPRQCLGKHVADLILRAIMGGLLKRYEMSLENINGNTAAEAIQLQVDSWIGLPTGKVRLTRRLDSM